MMGCVQRERVVGSSLRRYRDSVQAAVGARAWDVRQARLAPEERVVQAERPAPVVRAAVAAPARTCS